MIICNDHRFVFIHIPNTGGKSLRQCLEQQGHVTFDEYKEWKWLHPTNKTMHLTYNQMYNLYTKEQMTDYYKFTIIRNPWELATSNFYGKKEMSAAGKTSKDKVWRDRLHGHTFETWMMGQDLSNASQKKWCVDDNDNVIIDKFIKFEEYETVVDFLKDQFGISLEMNRTNSRSVKRDYRKEWTQTMLDKFNPNIQWEIDERGYTF